MFTIEKPKPEKWLAGCRIWRRSAYAHENAQLWEEWKRPKKPAPRELSAVNPSSSFVALRVL